MYLPKMQAIISASNDFDAISILYTLCSYKQKSISA
jgi:hypothetical protein